MKKKLFASKSRKLAARLFNVDPRYQRSLIPARVRYLAKELDLDSLGIFHISDRGNGNYFIIDGQNRHGALKELDLLDWECDCRVYEGLSLQDEAKLYRTLNDARRLTKWDMFKAGIVAGDIDCCRIEEICGKFGLKPGKSNSDGNIRCVAALEKIYRKHSPDVLTDTLRHAVQSFGREKSAPDGDVLLGLALVVSRHGHIISWPDLHLKLAKTSGSAAVLLGKARQMRLVRPGHSVAWCVGSEIIEIYNSGRRTSKIAWQD